MKSSLVDHGFAVSTLDSRLRAAARGVERALDEILPPPEGPEGRLMEAMRYAALGGGKRLRPFMTLETGAMFDADGRGLMRAACAIECVHAYSLIHDDLPCMDNDDLRHGRPTVHKQFDEVTALLAGDALLTLAFEILCEPATLCSAQTARLLVLGLARAAGPRGMVAGQMIDMLGPQKDLTLPTIARMNRLKTGALISFSVEAGALLGAASPEQQKALTRFADEIGALFQMADDLLDVESSSNETGKAVGKDAAQGKVNHVTLLGLEGAREQVRLSAARAKSHLELFGPRASILSQSVDFIVNRRH